METTKNKLLELVQRYDVAAPRYTSYPTVPCWDENTWSPGKWIHHVRLQLAQSSSRGISLYVHLPFCESLCTYCGCNTRITKNHGVEVPYIDAVLAEWKLYRNHLSADSLPISEIHLGGGTPTFFSPIQLDRLVAGLLDGNHVLPGASFSFEAHPANTTIEHLQLLFDAGFRRLSLGIQDFDSGVQQLINRRQTEADVWRVMKDARQIGYTSINFDLIYGLPLQTLKSVSDTVKKALAMRPDRISFYSYAHVPWMRPGQRRYTEEDLPKGRDKLELYLLGKSAIKQAGYRDVGMDHFALPNDALCRAADDGSLHRNFMGYTDRYTPLLIGLGVSSISDSWTAFAQNVKTVEEYKALVNAGQLPVFKGHVLSTADLSVRKRILDIMCRGTTILDVPAAQSATILRRLAPLFADGLVSWDGLHVKVTKKGFSFLRNICMAFDERLHAKHYTHPLFSKAV
ncbi:oxygen-independent coproporphyrinogen III oxidase [Parapedobacter koreensis]|uniref:Coproporphyrinogen-III oxidase n=1 Tax=Parapedobacter koreensis TaxID=332977 RepID=A0A1H7JLG6_9SPHI|nr:oxygen-independent coproporphyrinogen III oxidase [Parapedobacter koreensis]SEK75392.1 oxygen-independent coproporphyrinogen-3 oxidase [Parapedobacter koreensis]